MLPAVHAQIIFAQKSFSTDGTTPSFSFYPAAGIEIFFPASKTNVPGYSLTAAYHALTATITPVKQHAKHDAEEKLELQKN